MKVEHEVSEAHQHKFYCQRQTDDHDFSSPRISVGRLIHLNMNERQVANIRGTLRTVT